MSAERAGEFNSIRHSRQGPNKYIDELAAILAWKPTSEINRHCFALCKYSFVFPPQRFMFLIAPANAELVAGHDGAIKLRAALSAILWNGKYRRASVGSSALGTELHTMKIEVRDDCHRYSSK